MDSLTLIVAGTFGLLAGAIFGYLARQSIARKQIGTLEEKIQRKISQARAEAEAILSEGKKAASNIIESVKREENQRRRELLRMEQYLLKKENVLDQKFVNFEREERDLRKKAEKIRDIKEELESLKGQATENLAKVSELSKEDAKKELLAIVENESQKDILEKIRNLERDGREQLGDKAKTIVALAIQKCALSQAQEITTTTLAIPSDEVKGRIIGKEGRNIRTLEKLTGAEIVVDDTPEVVVISAFDPIRRQIAKIALEKLIQDGRIQPARIEEVVAKTEEDIAEQIKKAGEAAVYDVGIIGLDPRLVRLLGRLQFRTSYGQNVLLHSIEVAHLAAGLAAEIKANVLTAKKAGLLHDIGKAVDYQIEGSHTEIGVKILEKFGAEKSIIQAMKSHHEDCPPETVEAILVQTADQISGARPGARKDTLENYLKRLEDLEAIAVAFPSVEKAWALQAGREIRVFVRPEEIDDLSCYKLAKDIAGRVHEELRYPGEIKVNIIRELRVIEYAK